MSHPIPYDKFRLIGLDKEAVNSLPPEALADLAAGRPTQLIVLNRMGADGRRRDVPVKLQLKEGHGGDTELVLYPVNRQFRNGINVGPVAFGELSKGNPRLVNDQYLQVDPQTNCVVRFPKEKIEMEKRLADIEKVVDIELGAEQKTQVRLGKPVQLDAGGETVVVGLDLRQADRFKLLKGDLKEWERQKAIDYDIAHPEFVGLVQTDENRWEQREFLKESFGQPSELKNRPAQTRSAGMRP